MNATILDLMEPTCVNKPEMPRLKVAGQAEQVLQALTNAMPNSMTTAEIREATYIENISGRVGELRKLGYRIETLSYRSSRDRTAEYRLTSRHRRDKRTIDHSLEIYRDSWDGLTVRIRPTGLSDRYNEAQLEVLRSRVQEVVEKWEWEQDQEEEGFAFSQPIIGGEMDYDDLLAW
ncbi:MAG: hypothetical protein H6739_29360 [Alphaproteobacteria bacterium]|nr:hypothetical protein [Alphaproteobacteria bacterium]